MELSNSGILALELLFFIVMVGFVFIFECEFKSGACEDAKNWWASLSIHQREYWFKKAESNPSWESVRSKPILKDCYKEFVKRNAISS